MGIYNVEFFKQYLERYLGIIEWSPTDYQVFLILNSIEDKRTKQEVLQVVTDIYSEDILFLGFEGVDNSDINTLLMIATKVRANDDE